MTNETLAALPSFRSYGNYSSSNYGAHCLNFTDPNGNEFWFSYQTLVAFRKGNNHPAIVHQNDWGTTTGKHLNLIDGGDKTAKKARLSAFDFKVALVNAFATKKKG